MKCRDCEHWGWGDDEGTPVWGWCWIRTSCPDPDIERTCPDFSPKAPDIFTTLSTLQADNEKLRAELEQAKREPDAAIADLRRIGPEGLCRSGPQKDEDHPLQVPQDTSEIPKTQYGWLLGRFNRREG